MRHIAIGAQNFSVERQDLVELYLPVRAATASREVLESLVQALHLDANEREHLFFLAHYQPPPETAMEPETVSPALQHFLDSLGISPAYVLGRRWDIVAWNRAACAIFGDFRLMTARERNIVWRLFTLPLCRQLLIDWEGYARRVLAQFRASYDRFLDDPCMRKLLHDLMLHSPEFRAWWPKHDILGAPEGKKMLNHPQVGYLVFEHLTFQVHDSPELKVTVYTPGDEADTSAKVFHLLNTLEYA